MVSLWWTRGMPAHSSPQRRTATTEERSRRLGLWLAGSIILLWLQSPESASLKDQKGEVWSWSCSPTTIESQLYHHWKPQYVLGNYKGHCVCVGGEGGWEDGSVGKSACCSSMKTEVWISSTEVKQTQSGRVVMPVTTVFQDGDGWMDPGELTTQTA